LIGFSISVNQFSAVKTRLHKYIVCLVIHYYDYI
jgi:hypothetical protein